MSIIKKITDAIKGIPGKRSSKWASVRKAFLEKNPNCAACGGTEKLEVHHIQMFHEHPELELEESNLIVLCEAKKYGVCCHLAWGHNGRYTTINENVKEDSSNWNKKLGLKK